MDLYETHIPVADTQLATEFYQRVVGLVPAYRDPKRDISFLWIGAQRASMIGLWGPSTSRGSKFQLCHFALRVTLPDLLARAHRLVASGINCFDFIGNKTTEPSVIGWIPSAQLYFRDLDGHSLEYIAVLDDPPEPDFIDTLSAWQKRYPSPKPPARLAGAAPDLKIRQVLETALYVADLDRSIEFYQRTLGLSLASPPISRMCALAIGKSQVLLLFKKGASVKATVAPYGIIPPSDGDGSLHVAFLVPGSEFESWCAWLKREVQLESILDWPNGGRSLYFRDPDTHLIELKTSYWNSPEVKDSDLSEE